jgi:hypothetical protein
LKIKDEKELDELRSTIDNNPILFVKIPEIDKYLNKVNKSPTSQQSQQNLSASPNPQSEVYMTPPSSESPRDNSPTNSPIQQQTAVKNFLKYLFLSSHNNQQQQQQQIASSNSSNTFAIFAQLCEMRFLNIMPTANSCSKEDLSYYYDFTSYSQNVQVGGLIGQTTNNRPPVYSTVPLLIESELCEKWHLFMPTLVAFIKRYLKSFSVRGTTILFKFHEYCLSKFINFAFEMARDLAIMPRKIEYAREKEQILFESLQSLTSSKQEELRNIINTAIESNREQILYCARNYVFVDVELTMIENNYDSGFTTEQQIIQQTQNEFYSSSEESTSFDSRSRSSSGIHKKKVVTVKFARDYKKCTNQIQELVINKLNNAIGQKLTESVEILKENYIGTLKRCLKTLEDANNLTQTSASYESNSSSVSEALQQVKY